MSFALFPAKLKRGPTSVSVVGVSLLRNYALTIDVCTQKLLLITALQYRNTFNNRFGAGYYAYKIKTAGELVVDRVIDAVITRVNS